MIFDPNKIRTNREVATYFFWCLSSVGRKRSTDGQIRPNGLSAFQKKVISFPKLFSRVRELENYVKSN